MVILIIFDLCINLKICFMMVTVNLVCELCFKFVSPQDLLS